MEKLQEFVNRLRDLGFGTDADISGSDVIDLINEYWEYLDSQISEPIPRPMAVYRVYDKPGVIDRYTVVLERDGDEYECLCLSSNPDHPQGFSQYGTCSLEADLGTPINWTDLPENVRQHVIERLSLCALL